MANRGTPLPWSLRQKIAALRKSEEPLSIRAIASMLGVSVNTVRKYENKFDTKSLPTTTATT